MDKPLFPDNEDVRLAALRALNILDTQSEESLDRVTRLAKYLFDVPIALISLIVRIDSGLNHALGWMLKRLLAIFLFVVTLY